MSISRPYTTIIERLRNAGLRPTRQRKELGRLLFGGPDRHVTAESLHDEASRAGIRVSLATVYNTLNQFTDAGLMREIVVDGDRAYFDTNVSDHHHFFHTDTGQRAGVTRREHRRQLQHLDQLAPPRLWVGGHLGRPGGERHVDPEPARPQETVERVDVIVRVSGARR